MTGAPDYAREYFERGKGLDKLKDVRDFAVVHRLLDLKPGDKLNYSWESVAIRTAHAYKELVK